jgi:nucleoside-diphosphate-sugar epimerase
MNILLTGASGFIGHHILQELERQEHQVVACCRSAKKLFFKSKSTSVLQKDFTLMTNPTDWLPYLDTIDVVINCVGIISETSKVSAH